MSTLTRWLNPVLVSSLLLTTSPVAWAKDKGHGHEHEPGGGYPAQAGHCPPGLAKKHNGCQPPGQAKKWAVGSPLDPSLRLPVPPEILIKVGPPPAGHEWVRVAGDIVLVAVGTAMVIKGIEGLLK